MHGAHVRQGCTGIGQARHLPWHAIIVQPDQKRHVAKNVGRHAEGLEKRSVTYILGGPLTNTTTEIQQCRVLRSIRLCPATTWSEAGRPMRSFHNMDAIQTNCDTIRDAKSIWNRFIPRDEMRLMDVFPELKEEERTKASD